MTSKLPDKNAQATDAVTPNEGGQLPVIATENSPENIAHPPEMARDRLSMKPNVSLSTDVKTLVDCDDEPLISEEGDGDGDDDFLDSISVAFQALNSLEIQAQQGTQQVNGETYYPGRVNMLSITLLIMLFATVSFAGAIIHFSVAKPHFLIPFAIVQILQLALIGLYHSSYRTQRHVQKFIHLILYMMLSGLVIFVLFDTLSEFKKMPAILIADIATYAAGAVLLLVHWVYLGRGYHKR